MKKIFIKNHVEKAPDFPMATTIEIVEWAFGRVGDVKQPKMFKCGTKYLSINEE